MDDLASRPSDIESTCPSTPFGPSTVVSGSAYLFARLSARRIYRSHIRMIIGIRVHCRFSPRDRPSIRFLFVESESWAGAPFRFHLAMDTLACPGGSDHHGPQRTRTSNTHHMPGKQGRGPYTPRSRTSLGPRADRAAGGRPRTRPAPPRRPGSGVGGQGGRPVEERAPGGPERLAGLSANGAPPPSHNRRSRPFP